MRHAFLIAGTETEAWLARDGAAYRLTSDAGKARIALEEGPQGAVLVIDGRSEPVTVIAQGEDLFIHAAGANHVVRHLDPTRRFADGDQGMGADAARAPMPGTVVRIEVAAGQKVAAGDPLIVIESMKLETTIRAWHDGEVVQIHVAQGQSFDRDAILVTLAAEAG